MSIFSDGLGTMGYVKTKVCDKIDLIFIAQVEAC